MFLVFEQVEDSITNAGGGIGECGGGYFRSFSNDMSTYGVISDTQRETMAWIL